MKAAKVKLEKVGKRYGDLWAVRQITLHIERGEFFTFLGPSGCGKSTLLRTIAGFLIPDEGTVYLDGAPVNHVPPWERDVGMVFQNYALWPHMTVFENVAFGLRERKIPRDEIKDRVLQALDQVDLKGTERRRPSQLSGGQQQRRDLHRDPGIPTIPLSQDKEGPPRPTPLISATEAGRVVQEGGPREIYEQP